MQSTGRIHSIESLGAVDGPGLRTVVFLQGCPLRCAYCHNPDTWAYGGGVERTSEEVARQVKRFHRFTGRTGGGMTLSGGEPMGQPVFAAALMEAVQRAGIHCALDTSGTLDRAAARAVLGRTDLLLLDTKSCFADRYQALTQVSRERFEVMLEVATALDVPVWLRHVMVPGYTDGEDEKNALHALFAAHPVIKRVMVLPFHKMGEGKWRALDMESPLALVPEGSLEKAKQWEEAFGEEAPLAICR